MNTFNYQPSEIPEDFICPITQTIMSDPVIGSDGNTYERQAILTWLERNLTSPISRERMTSNTVIPNRALKALIDLFLQNGTIGGRPISSSGLGTFNRQTQQPTQPPIPLTTPDMQRTVKCVESPFNKLLYEYTHIVPIGQFMDIRIPTTFEAIVDVSGSMQVLCSNNGNSSNPSESDGLSRLDITKYSLETVVSMLSDRDEFILIKFSDRAECMFKGMMTNVNKLHVKNLIKNLQTEGSTNIWDALRVGLDQLSGATNENIKIMLLTDGESNSDPPMGILPTLKKHLERHFDADKLSNIELTMFGFSCDVDSKLLFDISELMNSSFNFIPDASMVGTTFINYLSNSLKSQYERHIVKQLPISIDVEEPYEIVPYEIVLFDTLSNDEKYELIRFHVYEVLKTICSRTDAKNRILNDLMTDNCNKLEEFIHQNISTGNNSLLLKELYRDFRSIVDPTNDEQITKALSNREWFRKWGYHYLLSLASAHKIRKCHNFRDKGVQMYGNALFERLKEETNDVFCSLPPPRPSIRTASNQTRPINMSSYVNSSGSCFAPWCRIKLFDNSYKRLDELTGDELLFINGSDFSDPSTAGKIKYITKTKVIDGVTEMCKISNLYITIWHPINYPDCNGNMWRFPCYLTTPFMQYLDYEYNIVLEQNQPYPTYSVIIENIECVTMGHCIDNFNDRNQILEHEYYGTQRVVNDIERFANNNSKIVIIENYQLMRGNDNLICGIVPV